MVEGKVCTYICSGGHANSILVQQRRETIVSWRWRWVWMEKRRRSSGIKRKSSGRDKQPG